MSDVSFPISFRCLLLLAFHIVFLHPIWLLLQKFEICLIGHYCFIKIKLSSIINCSCMTMGNFQQHYPASQMATVLLFFFIIDNESFILI